MSAGINVEKLVSVEGGQNWYFNADESADTITSISAASGIGASRQHTGTPETFKYEFVVTNTSDMDLPAAMSVMLNDSTLHFSHIFTGSLASGASDT